jgi:hypothetical protein
LGIQEELLGTRMMAEIRGTFQSATAGIPDTAFNADLMLLAQKINGNVRQMMLRKRRRGTQSRSYRVASRTKPRRDDAPS